MKSTADYISKPSQRAQYEVALERHFERVKRSTEQQRMAEAWFPSTLEGSRGAGSPLGTGFAKPAEEKK
jgi:hypothetical protein